MPSITKTIEILNRHAGLPAPRIRQVVRKLQDAALLPLGSAKCPPQVSHKGLALILLALLTDAPIRAVADVADDLSKYRNSGDQIYTFDFIANLIDILANRRQGHELAAAKTAPMSFSVVTGEHPAIVLRADVVGVSWQSVFTPQGKPWGYDNSNSVHLAMTLPGTTFIEIARAFGDAK